MITGMSGVLLLLLGVVLGVRASPGDEELPVAQSAGVSSDDRLWETSERADSRQGRIFAYYSTTSYTKLATSTVTRLSTCLSVTSAKSCQGRKKRSMYRFAGVDNVIPEDLELLSSKRDEEVEPRAVRDLSNKSGIEEEEVIDRRKGKNLTIWSTAFSTLTLTSTSYLASTTVTASAMCIGLATASCFGK